jgi:hypothetical protein
MRPIWAVKIRPRTPSGRHSWRAIAKPAGAPRPQRDDDPAEQETQAGQAQRWGVEEAELDGDGVAAPEERHEQGQRGARRVDVAGRVTQSGARSGGGDSGVMERRPL